MAFVYRGGYGFTDFFNNLKGDFFVLDLCGLHRFDFGGHFVTSTLNIAGMGQLDKR